MVGERERSHTVLCMGYVLSCIVSVDMMVMMNNERLPSKSVTEGGIVR